MKILLEHERACLFHGDSADLGEYLPENSIDAIVCDPPASVGFMNKSLDLDRGGFDNWTQWLAGVLAPSVRALKPGGYCLLWALPRTSHWAARAIELAGLEIRDVHHDIVAGDTLLQAFVAALDDAQRTAFERLLASQSPPIFCAAFGSGFPKSLDISKAIDQHLNAERVVTGVHTSQLPGGNVLAQDAWSQAARESRVERKDVPATAAATAWSGFGTALKPAVEHWILARKPLEGTYAENVLTHGVGGLNIDASRIGTETRVNPPAGNKPDPGGSYMMSVTGMPADAQPTTTGRWPAHLSLQHAPGCEVVGETVDTVRKDETVDVSDRDGNGTNFAMGVQREAGKVEIPRAVYRCAPGCPIAELDAQSGVRASGARAAGVRQGRRKGKTYGDQNGDGGPEIAPNKGGASRFFFNAPPFNYIPKASRREKDAGLAHLRATTGGEATGREDGAAGVANPRAGAGRTGGARNIHPTCKSISLMKWLIGLIAPPGSTVLDMFAGSGTTGVAALELGMSFIGVDSGGDNGEYLPILVGRIRSALGLEPDLTLAQPEAAPAEDAEQDGDESRSYTED